MNDRLICFFTLVAAAILFVVSLGQATSLAQAGPAGKTVLDGVYTIDQATRGEIAYKESCGDCHQQDLSGGDRGPALAGDVFMKEWITLTVGDLFDRVRTSMPMDSPGSLTAEATGDIVAFMLRANDYPAGSVELPSDLAGLKGITITNRK